MIGSTSQGSYHRQFVCPDMFQRSKALNGAAKLRSVRARARDGQPR